MKQTSRFAYSTHVTNVQRVYTRVIYRNKTPRLVICNWHTMCSDSNTELAKCGMWVATAGFFIFVTSPPPPQPTRMLSYN